MSVKKFRFVSPGIFINEIDRSQIPAEPARMGPVIIGRSERGPGFRPTTVSSLAEFVETFGNPIPGKESTDVWRDGNYNGPTYAAYAAQAYLKHSSPVTFIRLLGAQHASPDTWSDTTIGQHGNAGWSTKNLQGANGGAYGLFVMPSGSNSTSPTNHGVHHDSVTGTLAAVWYLNEGYMQLSGTLRGSEGATVVPTAIAVSGSSVLLGNVDSQSWKAIIYDGSDNEVIRASFNFDPDDDAYIRKVFNTNPQLVNDSVYSTTKNYWLGESYDRAVQDNLNASSSAGTANNCWGVLLQLASGSAEGEYSKQRKEHIPSETGWIISQDVSSDYNTFAADNQNRAVRLFKFVSLDAGSEWNQNNIKISIEDIRPAKNNKTWPTFSVTIRVIDDTDKNQKILEKFGNCNMNPASTNYIARRIGDRETVYDKTNKGLKFGGDYENKSKYVRVKTREEYYSREYLPFGFYGPPRYKGFTFSSGSITGEGCLRGPVVSGHSITDLQNTFIKAGSDMDHRATGSRNDEVLFSDEFTGLKGIIGPVLSAGEIWVGTTGSFSGAFAFPSLALRAAGSDGGISDETKAYWGVDTTRRTANDVRFDRSVTDYIRTLPDQTSRDTIDFHLASDNFNAECQFVFTLDDIMLTSNTGGDFKYVSGSRQVAGTAEGSTHSLTAMSGTNFLLTSSDAGVDKFTTLMYGGFDGLDIKEPEPFNNSRALSSAVTEKSSYAYFSVQKAIEILKDPERIECNLLTAPGITNQNITKRLVTVAEDRADTMAIIDIEEDYKPFTENTDSTTSNQGNLDSAVRTMKDRVIDSSYGAAYYPWVQVQDPNNNRILWVPPSVVALGAMGYSESVKDVWFAPAGFSRGGLTSTGAGGLPVVGVNQQLTSKQRDKLYEVNVNPIASFPAEGIVIFGQKTLQLTPSALDRINVRRLLIFLKKEISRIASTILFDPNLEVTWSTFTAQADALLSSVKSRLGLADYKLVLDKSTTTPDLVDRNIMYAKVYLKPARAIEFIALDFIVTRSGASFED
tara:strand:+ start:2008 stop:5073 length:3066 start_codon:yes stop_codon:yes gene_type:complete